MAADRQDGRDAVARRALPDSMVTSDDPPCSANLACIPADSLPRLRNRLAVSSRNVSKRCRCPTGAVAQPLPAGPGLRSPCRLSRPRLDHSRHACIWLRPVLSKCWASVIASASSSPSLPLPTRTRHQSPTLSIQRFRAPRGSGRTHEPGTRRRTSAREATSPADSRLRLVMCRLEPDLPDPRPIPKQW